MSGAVEGVASARDAIARAIDPDAWRLHAMMSKLRDMDPFHASKLDMSLAAADRVLAAFTTPPARSYADAIEDAAKVADDYALGGHEGGNTLVEATAETIAAAIRLLSQGEKA